MADMGLQLEPITQSLEPYGPWHLKDVRFQQHHRAELEAALLQTAAISGLSDTLREISKASRADCHGIARPEVTLSVSKTVKSGCEGPALPTAVTLAASSPKPEAGWSLPPPAPSVFTQITPSGKEVVVTFPLPPRPVVPRPCLKRRRPDTDVDGHNTAPLSCKKRRLRRRLITSRLSQPFSLPATHILTRESAATGGKRFVKLAAIMSARRLNSAVASPSHGTSPQQQQQQQPQQPSPSTWLRRAAVLNSLRGRVSASPDLAIKAAVFEQGHGAAAAVVVGGRYLVHPAGSSAPPAPSPALSGSRGPPAVHRPGVSLPPPPPASRPPFHTPGSTPPNHFPRPPPPAATFLPGTSAPTTAALLRPTTTPYPLTTATTATTSATTTTTTPPTTATSSMPPPPLPATHRLRIPSPTLRPLRSPELRVTRPPPCVFSLNPLDEEIRLGPGLNGNHDDDDDDDDGVAFPTSALEGRYMCDDEDDEDYHADGGGRERGECVYADFSVIFGGGRAASDDGEGGEGGGCDGGGEHYEDYMDDLDGIPWCARC